MCMPLIIIASSELNLIFTKAGDASGTGFLDIKNRCWDEKGTVADLIDSRVKSMLPMLLGADQVYLSQGFINSVISCGTDLIGSFHIRIYLGIC